MAEKIELCGIAEAAEIFGVGKQTLYNWTKGKRKSGRPSRDNPSAVQRFPEPVARLKMGPVWLKEELLTWKKQQEEKS